MSPFCRFLDVAHESMLVDEQQWRFPRWLSLFSFSLFFVLFFLAFNWAGLACLCNYSTLRRFQTGCLEHSGKGGGNN